MWMSVMDLVEESITGGAYYWGFPMRSRLKMFDKGDLDLFITFLLCLLSYLITSISL